MITTTTSHALLANGDRTYHCAHPDGKPHRIGGPAEIQIDRRQGFVLETWKRHGTFHRDDGPAWIRQDTKTGAFLWGWYRHGEKYQPSAHERLAATRMGFHPDTRLAMEGRDPRMGADRERWIGFAPQQRPQNQALAKQN